MSVYVALLRAVNVGGTGKLPMKELAALCGRLGFDDVETYIQSGNVVFETRISATKARAELEKALTAKLGKPALVLLRSASEMSAVEQANPFVDEPPNRVLVMFFDKAPQANVLSGIKAPGREQLSLKGRELYIYYPDGMGKSKLKVPLADVGTARNLNTVRKLAAMAAAAGRTRGR